MTFQIELDEGTAARRRIPFKLFTSDGTSPDTGASGDSVMYSVNGGAQSDLTASVISANAGMYYAEFAQADVDTLGSIAMWHDAGDFEQHVANIQVVNNNPMSTQSNFGTFDVNAIQISGDATAANNLEAAFDGTGYDSDLTVFVKDSVATITGVTNSATLINALNDIDGSGVTLHAGTHSDVTIKGIENDSVMTIAGVTNSATLINALNDIDGSGVTLHAGTHTSAVIPTVTAVTNEVTADITAISGDATAANNLEAAFDGTGYDSQLTTLTLAGGVTDASIATAVWNADLSKHSGADTMGLVMQVTSTGSRLQGGTVSDISLGSGETSVNDIFNGAPIEIEYEDGTRVGTRISDYTGATVSAFLEDTLSVAPNSNCSYTLFPGGAGIALSNATIASVLTVHGHASTASVTLAPISHSNATIQGLSNRTDFTVGTNQDKPGYSLSAAGELSAASSMMSMDLGSSRYPQEAFFLLRNRVDATSGSVMTVYRGNDTDSAWTASVATGDFPVSEINPL